MKNINVILFDDFTILDAFGPVDVLNRLDKQYVINYYSYNGGNITTSPGITFETKSFSEISRFDVVLIPGGFGTRKLVDDYQFIAKLKSICEKSEVILTVCTGSALLAKTGLLKNRKATSNKMAFDWVMQQDTAVKWIRKARWMIDGKYYTSSGVTAGIDMALAFVKDTFDPETAKQIATALEYNWNSDSENDLFA